MKKLEMRRVYKSYYFKGLENKKPNHSKLWVFLMFVGNVLNALQAMGF
ncbi:hypothetical protein HYU22_00920 [Candidatus Woesearchaeota archaeon]|nr:hypothetical protein [Candidatus Woesearchaeota archaeon]